LSYLNQIVHSLLMSSKLLLLIPYFAFVWTNVLIWAPFSVGPIVPILGLTIKFIIGLKSINIFRS
jgi:hypothetical protein